MPATHKKLTGDQYRFSIDQIIWGSCVKYERMDKIVYEAFSNTAIASATELNVFIDLYSILHPLFSEHYRVDFVNYTDITSCLINLCGLYRGFFRRLGVNTTFYLIYSSNCCPINRKYVSDYNQIFFNKIAIPESKKITDDNFKLLTAMCPYLPDIHFIESKYGFEVAVIIAYLIEMLNDGKPNMIISRDLYPIQLTYLYPYTTFLYSKKNRVDNMTKTVDNSTLIPVFEKASYREEFWKLIASSRSYRLENVVDLSPVNYTMFCAANAFTDRNLKAVHEVRKASALIRNMVGGENIKITPAQLKREEILKSYNVGLIEARFNALDVPFMLPYYKNSPESGNIKLLNLNDNAVINKINAKYFERNPIDLQIL